jgi:dephospho-CoA kinase
MSSRSHPTAAGKRIVGLAGGIGAGKSLIADRLRAWGALVVDADRTGHEVLGEPSVRETLIKTFGAGIAGEDGTIDRKRLAAVVFSDPEQRRSLEAIVHPAMMERFQSLIQQGLEDDSVPLIVLDAAILMEVGWDRVCDTIIYVDAPRSTRLARVQQNRGWDESELARRESAQWSVERKRDRAHIVIDNSRDAAHALAQVDEMMRDWGYCAQTKLRPE